MNNQTRFRIGDIIATDLDHPHMVLDIVQNENKAGRRYGEYWYILLDLSRGQHNLAHAPSIDVECAYHDELNTNTPKSFDGALLLREGKLSLKIKNTKLVYDKIQKVVVGVVVGVGIEGGAR